MGEAFLKLRELEQNQNPSELNQVFQIEMAAFPLTSDEESTPTQGKKIVDKAFIKEEEKWIRK